MNTMKKIVAFAMIVSMVLGCLVISTSAAAKSTYVKDGLVAWYDATNNSNGEHDVQADLWKDLSGNANHIDISAAVSNNQITWEDGALIIKDGGCYLQLPDAVKNALQGRAYTIEIVTGDLEYTATAYITLLSSANDELSVFIRCAEGDNMKLEYKNQDANGDSNRPYLYDGWNYFNGKTLAVTSDLDAFDGTRDMGDNPNQDGNVGMFSDGEKIGKGESEYPMELDYVYFGNTASNREWHGEIYGLRIYNRALTQEELQANAVADKNNYRSGNTFEPTVEYDSKLDENYVGFVKLEGYVNNRVVFNQMTDLIPLTGFFGSQNLLDYLYPYESDEVQWEGAKLAKTEELDTDYDGTVFTGTNFDILYQSFCTRAGIKPVEGNKCQYIVIKLIVEGEVEDFNMNTIGYDADTNSAVEFSTGSMYGGIDLDKQGEVQYLIYDVEGIFDECENIEKMNVDINGMTDDTAIYLQEIAFCATAEEAYGYAGEEVPTEPAETKPKETEPAQTEAATKAPTAGGEKETEAAAGGCASVVGFGAAAILVAAAAAVVLKKKD